MPVFEFQGIYPSIHPTAFVAEGADVIGQVTIGRGASIWFRCVVRGDVNRIAVGEETNVQDGSVLHVGTREPCVLGDRVTVGHLAVVHGARVGDGALIGMGATVLNRVRVGHDAIVAAGAVVPEGMRVPPRMLAVGVPARVVRRVTAAELQDVRFWVKNYCQRAQMYRASQGQA
ncbi:MAG: gamma carbonic anhydrase family protein [Candidatus Omnitrophica bacterium]|nr:gamma carbonic anhydrase family protein [Candidatus Omnitrophota bacterium]